MTDIVKKILEIKNKQGINDRQLELKAGLQPASIQAWKKGKKNSKGELVEINPSIDSIIKIAKTLNTSTDYLLGLTDEPNTLSVNENTSTELIKRPKYAVSDKFLEDYMNLLNDKHFANIAKVYNEFEESYKIQIYTYIIALATKVGLNVAKIVEW